MPHLLLIFCLYLHVDGFSKVHCTLCLPLASSNHIPPHPPLHAQTLYASDFCRGDESPGDHLTFKPAHASRSMLFFIGLSLGLIIAMLAVLGTSVS
jgi:hypothetical protein